MAYTSIPLPGRHASFTFASGNQGLYFNKFFNQWTRDFSETNSNVTGLLNGKTSWIMSHVHQEILADCQYPDDKPAHNMDKAAGDHDALASATGRTAELATLLDGNACTYVTVGPFITGMGLSHPVENGFLWHHTLGVPYLPGSSIKGMIRAWLRDWCGIEKGEDGYDEHIDEVAQLFGGPVYESYIDENGKEKQKEIRSAGVGNIIVFDALPVEPVKLYAEVITPHDGGWRITDKREENPPADWISPVPIPFLVVSEGAKFQFAIAPRNGANEGDLENAWKYLGEALEWIGAGAKTAVGFGRFENETIVEQKERDKKREFMKNLEAGNKVLHKGTKLVVQDIIEEDGTVYVQLKRTADDNIKPNGSYRRKKPEDLEPYTG
ncbi:MAG: type III-B CRISPR module RAMP protein Cmr6 [Hyphomicrobiales bacterium]|nr:type III-B CRISPR module RAMP protein Cmr6 [Hyphomicrobiales bacterium]